MDYLTSRQVYTKYGLQKVASLESKTCENVIKI